MRFDRSVVREEWRADPVREVRLVENIHWGVNRRPAKQADGKVQHDQLVNPMPVAVRYNGSQYIKSEFTPNRALQMAGP